MKKRSDVKVTTYNLKIFPWTFIWHKLGLNTFSHYRDRAAETLPKINLNCYSKQEDNQHSWLNKSDKETVSKNSGN